MAYFALEDTTAVISLNHPPVNALSKLVRMEVYNSVNQANNDRNVKGIIICGSNSMFSAGADINEFGSMDAKGFPTIYDIVMLLESSKKVTVAAIHGNAFGGGLELALGCHYRLSLKSARFSFPEVKLGILPGAGGTQRLPRVVDLIEAAEWIVSGKEISAEHAYDCGLVDCLFLDDLIKNSLTFVKEICKQNHNLDSRRLSLLPVKTVHHDSLIMMQSKQLHKHFRGAVAPLICWQTVLCGRYAAYGDGILHEKQAFGLLLKSDQSKAQIYAFFAERATSRWITSFGVSYLSHKPLQIKHVGIVGLGTMGRGIALAFLFKGFSVYAFEKNELALQNGTEYIHNVWTKRMSKSRLNMLFKPSSDFNDLQSVDLVIECVYESLELKKKVFKMLDSICKPSAILATNTSVLDISKIAQATNRPNMVVGMHFFAPAHLMPLLENIYCKHTSPVVLATVMHLGKLIGKSPVLVGNCHGFVGNRMYNAYNTESDFMLEEGAYPSEVDAALRDFGFPMGRYQVNDLSGIDVGYKIRQSLGLTKQYQQPDTPETYRNGRRYSSLSDLLVESGRCGQKSNWKGWFDYEDRKPVPSPDVRKIIDDYRNRNGFVPRKIHPQEILERMLYPLINEGFKVLEDGISSKPSDIDVIWLNGYSWPRHTGGPMYYAYTVGLPHVLDVLQSYWARAGPKEPHWQPSQLLLFLVKKFQNPPPNDWLKLATEIIGNNLKTSL